MARAEQTSLGLELGLPELKELKPHTNAREPKLWVETLEVHKEFPNEGKTLLRRIELRKGLNILWATASQDKSGRLGGHGAGKTTFCRLLRYVIGDARPGNKQFREAFRSQFPKGWVLADVWLSGERWMVARPLGDIGQHPFAVKGGSIKEDLPEKPARASYKDYETALDIILGGLTEIELSGSGKHLNWPLFLPWLTRDQEAHYASLIEWRARESESESEVSLSAVDRENLLRIILGLVDPSEQERLRERERMTQEHEKLVRERPQRAFHKEEAKKALEKLYSGSIGQPGELTFEASINDEISRLRKEAEDMLTKLQEDSLLAELVSEEATCKLAMEFVQEQLDEINEAVSVQKGSVKATEHRASDAKQLVGTTRFLPFKGYCSTPLEIARRDRCPCVTARPDDDEVEKKTNDIIESVGPENDRLERLNERLNYLKKDLDHRSKAYDEVVEKKDNRRKELRDLLSERSAPRENAAALEAAYNAWIAAEQGLTLHAKQLENLAKDKKNLDDQIEAQSKAHRKQLSAFEHLFHLMVQSLLGKKVTGRIGFSGGKTLEPELVFNGSFDSAALNLTKVLAFDIAALAFSQFEDGGSHARFLLHDSPRESDLAAPIYQSLFLTARALEEVCGDSIGFQYIITTTEPPPTEVATSPWLLNPVLDATKAEGRFLGVNL